MRVRFQYVDWSEWEGPPEEAHTSPDKGVVRMYVTDDCGRTIEFVYDDFYYLRRHEDGWLAGSGTPKREFIFRPGRDGAEAAELPVVLPEGTVVRLGQTVSQEEAVHFGLAEPTGNILSEKKPPRCIQCGQ